MEIPIGRGFRFLSSRHVRRPPQFVLRTGRDSEDVHLPLTDSHSAAKEDDARPIAGSLKQAHSEEDARPLFVVSGPPQEAGEPGPPHGALPVQQHPCDGMRGSPRVSYLNMLEPPPWDFSDASTAIPNSLEVALLPYGADVRSLTLVAFVPLYSEEGHALRRTLEALALQRLDMHRAHEACGGTSETSPEMHVFVIADGWCNSDGTRILQPSMLTEIVRLSGGTLDEARLTTLLDARSGGSEEEKSSSTGHHVLIEFEAASGGRLQPIDMDVSWHSASHARMGSPASSTAPLLVSVFIKRTNGKKHHSLRWFMEAFAQVALRRARCPYFFATDVGTIYSAGLLVCLVQHMDTHPRVGACTGFMRGMAASDQAAPGSSPEGFFARMLRSTQNYDFEAGLNIFNGMYALAGFLPVIHGPCGLFRAEALSRSLLLEVRAICTSEPETDGLIRGNLKISEDRVPSFLLLVEAAASGEHSDKTTKGGGSCRGWETHWVHTSNFYFEAEETLRELVLQRRRWKNGTVAGCIWQLTSEKLWLGVLPRGKHEARILLVTLVVLAFQLLMLLSPGFLCVAASQAVYTAILLLPVALPSVTGVLGGITVAAELLQRGILALHLGSFLVFVATARCSRVPFVLWVWQMRIGVVLLTIFVCCGTLVLFALAVAYNPVATMLALGMSNFHWFIAAFYLSTLNIISPVLLSFMSSHCSGTIALAALPSAFVMLPIMVGDMGIYSVARFDDFSWGTKDVGGGKSRSGLRASTTATLMFLMLCLCGNAAVSIVPLFAPQPSRIPLQSFVFFIGLVLQLLSAISAVMFARNTSLGSIVVCLIAWTILLASCVAQVVFIDFGIKWGDTLYTVTLTVPLLFLLLAAIWLRCCPVTHLSRLPWCSLSMKRESRSLERLTVPELY